MSKIKPERAAVKEVIPSFGGIYDGADCVKNAAQDIRNFRIRADGTLEKRNGWFTLFAFDHPLRGVWQGTLGEDHLRFAVTENQVWRFDPEEGILRTAGTLSTLTDDVGFVCYRSHLYLLDGNTVYVYRPATGVFSPAMGYAPLYGHNWHPRRGGDVVEPLNLFSRRLIVHYLNITGEGVFTLPFYADRIDRMQINGTDTAAYSFTSGSNSFTLSSPAAGDEVLVAFTVWGETAVYRELMRATHAYCHRDGTEEHLMLYGTPMGYRLYVSRPLDAENSPTSMQLYSDTDPLYLPADRRLTVGDGDSPIRALCPYNRRLFVFHDRGASALLTEGGLACYPVLQGIGCTAPGGAVSFGDGIAMIGREGILYLTSSLSEPDRLQVTHLSEPLGGLLPASIADYGILCRDDIHGELWVRDRSESDAGIVWVWNPASRCWYRFDGIRAEGFLGMDGSVGFIDGNRICLFSKGLYTDGGALYEACYIGGHTHFFPAMRVLRGISLRLCVAAEKSRLTVTLSTEKRSKSFVRDVDSSSPPHHLCLRAGLGRFPSLQLRIAERSLYPARIYHALIACNL